MEGRGEGRVGENGCVVMLGFTSLLHGSAGRGEGMERRRSEGGRDRESKWRELKSMETEWKGERERGGGMI